MKTSIDARLLKAYAMWGKNRVEFNRDSIHTLITFVWNEEAQISQTAAIATCVGGHLMTPAPGFVPGEGKTCYLLTKGSSVEEIIQTLEREASVEIYLHDRIK